MLVIYQREKPFDFGISLYVTFVGSGRWRMVIPRFVRNVIKYIPIVLAEFNQTSIGYINAINRMFHISIIY